MTTYIYICPACGDYLVAIPDDMHDRNESIPCVTPDCMHTLNPWNMTPDVREGEWEWQEYGDIRNVYKMGEVVDEVVG